MGRVLTNNTAFQWALEATETEGSRGIGFLPGEDPGDGGGAISGSPSWKLLEPNSISTFGATISTVARNPIQAARGRLKGAISDLDSAVEFEADITIDSMMDFVEGFAFARMSNDDLIFRGSSTDTTGDTYAVASLTAGQAAKLQSSATVDVLLYARGYANAANNGLKTLDTAASASDTSLAVSENLVTETAPSNAVLEIAGAIFRSGEMDLTVTSGVGTLAFDTDDAETFGLTVGQVIYVHMTTTVKGYARIASIDSTAGIGLDRLDSALVTSAPAGDSTLFYGQFVRDLATSNADFLERSFQFEAAFPGLGSAGAAEYEYAKGNFCNQLTLQMPLTDKATFSAGFIGTDTDEPVASGSRKANASSGRSPTGTTAFGTTADFGRLRIIEADETGLTTDFKSVELTISNNVSPEKVLDNLGAKFMNFGNFFVDVSAQALFTSGDVIGAIRDNDTVGMDFILENADGSICVDIPSMTLGGGGRDYPLNETILVNLAGQAFQDTVTGISLGISLIPTITPA